MTPWDLIVWALCGSVSIFILGIGTSLAVGMICAARALMK